MTYVKLVQFFEQGTSGGGIELLQEFATIRRSNYPQMAAFLLRVQHLHRRLEISECGVSDTAYLWLALKGIATEYPDVYSLCVAELNNRVLGWEGLMSTFRHLAALEVGQPAATSLASCQLAASLAETPRVERPCTWQATGSPVVGKSFP
ncbi:hypothetical protein F5144DRAFT_337322 [Chaetomium tenue]|uniref:Uncharacterized protein n=1 Tax=Chaetomium tenue TaxID=1854479 RepID=A0ACB7NYQ2_9PEZI|nr:hypothetical protein F5144DRAFT_337322 [Chaetomium globosum]